MAGRRLFPRAQLIHAGVGGAGLQHSPPALRDEVIAALREADMVGVRDRQTLTHLHAAGIPAHLMPDPAVLTAERFGATIRAHASRGEVAAIGQRFPRGYLAVQFSADFGDDATLDTLAAKLSEAAAASDCGIVLFRAGSAPWHDTLDCLERLASRLPAATAQVFRSLQLWDICAPIAGSRGYCGSSLHGRIVATAFARPHLNVLPPQRSEPGKVQAYIDSWEAPALPATAPVDMLAARLGEALAADTANLRRAADSLADRYQRSFTAHLPRERHR